MIPSLLLLVVVGMDVATAFVVPLARSGPTMMVGLRSSSSSNSDDYDDWYADYNPADYETESVNGSSGVGRTTSGHGYRRDSSVDQSNVNVAAVDQLLEDRNEARRRRRFDVADEIRDELLAEHGVVVWDKEQTWRSGASASGSGQRRPSSRTTTSRGDRPDRRGRAPRASGRSRDRDFGPNGHDYQLAEDAGPMVSSLAESEIHSLLAERLAAKMARDFRTADRLQAQLLDGGVVVDDGSKRWRADGAYFDSGRERTSRTRAYEPSLHSQEVDAATTPEIQALVDQRTQAKAARDFARADDLRAILRQDFAVWIDDRLRQWSRGGDFGPGHQAAVKTDQPYTQSATSGQAEHVDYIVEQVALRVEAKNSRDFVTADAIRAQLLADYNVHIDDRRREWSVGGDFGDEPRRGRQEGYRQSGGTSLPADTVATIQELVEQRAQAKKNRDFATADAIRDQLLEEYDVSFDDRRKQWSVGGVFGSYACRGSTGDLTEDDLAAITSMIAERSEAKKNRDYDTADSIRDELRESYAVEVDDKSREWSVATGRSW